MKMIRLNDTENGIECLGIITGEVTEIFRCTVRDGEVTDRRDYIIVAPEIDAGEFTSKYIYDTIAI